MKKGTILASILGIFLLLCGFALYENSNEEYAFDINDLYDYHKEFDSEEIEVCASNGTKTYMDYRMTTVRSSAQYKFLRNECTVDDVTGFLYDKDGFIAVALGSFYGTIGDRFYFTLDSGVVLPLVKGEEKADVDTDSRGCYHTIDDSIIEFVIDEDIASIFFWSNDNGLPLNGNYNNYPLLAGEIVKVEKVLDTRRKGYFSLHRTNDFYPDIFNIFSYGIGY